MDRLSGVFEPYTEPGPQLIVFLTAIVLLLEGLAATYKISIAETLVETFTIPASDWISLIFGSFFFEPVLLFGVIYYVGARYEHPSILKLLPGVVVAIAVGSTLGWIVGDALWISSALQGTFGIFPRFFLLWSFVITPFVRDLLTVVAALGLARAG